MFPAAIASRTKALEAEGNASSIAASRRIPLCEARICVSLINLAIRYINRNDPSLREK
jgi:hypothetical protein